MSGQIFGSEKKRKERKGRETCTVGENESMKNR
jgi:hypothetical protein